ncbi:ras-related protein M-Ras-like [Latimeria chalumnae]|uniref:Small monomeric GTPase n=1 Tax=Latimeria chalumnae TaxID=7897 RepID=M3XHF5_LATCH|nr:PREDICTED: ras-related protein M-Ras-like isoform X1 [Latimeria chalumnae]|eukprot:XP_014342040.1 PREDICTED: ras-related protein M-Ras-like isoform X1 [Latimeria chalumnae]
MATGDIESEYITTYNVVVVGDAFVGKSALAIQFSHDVFVSDLDPTIEDSYVKRAEIDGQVAIINVLDTAGLEEFSALQDQYLRTGEGFLLVYSVTDEKSFQRVQRLHELILRMKDRDSFPMILVANKVDLIHLRNISSKQGRELAAKYNIPYVETSAKDPPLNVCKVFFDLVRLIRHESSKGSQGEKITKQHSDKAVDFQKLKCTIF